MAIKKRTTSKQKAASRRNLEKARAAKKRAYGVPSMKALTDMKGQHQFTKSMAKRIQSVMLKHKNYGVNRAYKSILKKKGIDTSFLKKRR